MATRKLVINKDARPNSSESYVKGPVVVESKKGKRVAYDIRVVITYNLDGSIDKEVAVSTLDRVIYYALNTGENIEFDDESYTGTFTSYDNQYKIRALQDSDESWVINFRLPEEE